MASTPGKLNIREAVRRSRRAIWAHWSTLLGPVLAIAGLEIVISRISEWRVLSWLAPAHAIPQAWLAVAWHRALLLGRPMTLETLWRWTHAHWVFVGVTVAWRLPALVNQLVSYLPAFGAATGFAVWPAALYVGARFSVLLPAWAIGDERYQTPAGRLTRGHGVNLVLMTLPAFLWLMLLTLPLVLFVLGKGGLSGEPNLLQSAAGSVLGTVGTMIGIGALSYAYRDLTATEVEPATPEVLVTDGGGSLSGS